MHHEPLRALRAPRCAACCNDPFAAAHARAPARRSRPGGRDGAEGATLQNYNNELVTCIEDLRSKRAEVNKSIASRGGEGQDPERPRILTERLSRLNDNLARKIASRNEYDNTIQETEAAYAKIMESSQTLLHVLKRESVNLTKKQASS